AQHQRTIEVAQPLAEIAALAGRQRLALAQVLAGAEAAPRAGDHQAAQFGAGLEGIEGARQFGVHDRREAVEAVGAVQGNDAHAVFQREADLFVGLGHASSSSTASCSALSPSSWSIMVSRLK